MKRVKKNSIGGTWAKAGENVKDQDVLTILNGGDEIDSEYGTSFVVKMKTVGGEELNVRINSTSNDNLIDAYGDESEKWVGKTVRAHVIKALVSGKMRNVLYLAHPDWSIDDEGNFHASKSDTPDEITPDDIPF